MKFGTSPKGKRDASLIMNAVRDGFMNRQGGKPLFTDPDGVRIYRIFLHGLPWKKVKAGEYRAYDGRRNGWDQSYVVSRQASGGWLASLEQSYISTDSRRAMTVTELGRFDLMKTAKEYCTQSARRVPWAPRAGW